MFLILEATLLVQNMLFMGIQVAEVSNKKNQSTDGKSLLVETMEDNASNTILHSTATLLGKRRILILGVLRLLWDISHIGGDKESQAHNTPLEETSEMC